MGPGAPGPPGWADNRTHGTVAGLRQASPVCGAGGGRADHPGFPPAEPGIPRLVRAGARDPHHPRRTVGPGRRGARLVAGRRLHPGRPVLADPQHRPGAAAGRSGVRGLVDRVRGSRLDPAAPAAASRPRAGGARRAAGLLGVHRVGPVLAGVRRPLGRAGRQPVAASRGARPGRGGRRLADQLRPGRSQHGDRDTAAGPEPGGACGGGRRGRRGAGRGTGGVRPQPGRAPGPARHGGAGPAGPDEQQEPAVRREPAAVRPAQCQPTRGQPART